MTRARDLANIADGTFTATDLDLSGTLTVSGDATFDTNTLFVDVSANAVGIGTTSPSSSLHVAGQIEASTDTTTPTGGSAYFYKSSAGATVSGFTTVIETGGAGSRQERMRIDSSGNVGIGTASPTAKLHVHGAGSVPFRWGDTSSLGTLTYSGSDPIIQSNTGNLLFYSSVNERMRIDSSGNLLVDNTSAPYAGMKISTGNTSRAEAGLQVQTSTTGIGYILFGDGTGSAAYQGQVFYKHAQDALGFATTGTERMRIDSSGNLLLGTSNATFLSSGRKCFEVNGATNSIISLADAASGSTVSKFYIHNDQPNGVITYLSESGIDQRWYTGGGERMRLTNGGNFLVGTANALNSSHTIQKNGASTNALVVNNSSASIPYGIQVRYSLTDPNNTSSDYFGAYGGGTTPRFLVRSNGGIANYQANDVNLSDERVKTDIAPLGSMWDKFKALEIVTFKYKDQTHDDTNIGVIAQQVEAVAPEFVDNDGFGKTPEGEEPLKTIYTADLYHATIKALQEAMARIETLEAEVAALKGA